MTPDKLKKWRDGVGLTQAGAALALGVSLRSYAAWETGEYECEHSVMLGLACRALSASHKKLKPRKRKARA